MSIKKYETLLKTVDSKSLTRASEELGYTQSAISQMIKGLEDDLGLRLLIRDRSGVRLTDTGRELLPSIRAVCEANDNVYRLATELHNFEGNLLRIGLPNGLLSTPLIELLQTFSMEEPKLQLTLHQGTTGQLTRQLERGEVDGLFLPLRLNLPWAEYLDIGTETLLAFFPYTHPVEEGNFPLTALKNTVLILPEGPIGELIQTALLERNVIPQRIVHAQSDTAALSMVQAGLGIAFLPDSLTAAPGIVTRSTEPSMARKLLFYYNTKQSQSNATRQLIRRLDERLLD